VPGRCWATAGSVRTMITPRCPDSELAGPGQHVVAARAVHVRGDLRVCRGRIPEAEDDEGEVVAVDCGRIGRRSRAHALVPEEICAGPAWPGHFGPEVIRLDIIVLS